MKKSHIFKISFSKSWVSWVVFIYLLLIFLYTLSFCMSSGKNVLLASNELGDFLAGVFSPLAFLFLYLGYRQQSLEIQKNRNELEEQKRQLLLQSQPSFHFKDWSGSIRKNLDEFQIKIYFQLSNSGSMCRGLFITLAFDENYMARIPKGITSKEIIETNYNLNHEFYINYETSDLNCEDELPHIFLLMNYIDFNGKMQIQAVKIYFKTSTSDNFEYSHYQLAKSWFQ